MRLAISTFVFLAGAAAADLGPLAAQLRAKLTERQAGGIAVMSFAPSGAEGASLGQLIADRLSVALVNDGVRVVARQRVRDEEKNLGRAPSSEQMAAVARRLGVGTVINGSFTALEAVISIDAMMVDPAQGDMVGGASVSLARDAEVNARLGAAAAPISTPDPVPAASTGPRLLTVPAGTMVRVRLVDKVEGKTATVGKTYKASLDQALTVEDEPVAARLADVQLRVTETGPDTMALGLVTIKTVDGVARMVKSESIRQEATKGMSRTKTGLIGAAIGAGVGAAAGKGKGAAIGAAAGGGTGAAIGGRQKLEMPSEMLLEFKMAGTLTIEKRPQ